MCQTVFLCVEKRIQEKKHNAGRKIVGELPVIDVRKNEEVIWVE